MKIYVLQVNKVRDTPDMITSNYRAIRDERRNEYYANKRDAEVRRDEIYNGVKSLTGFIDNLEIIIKEVEVIE